MSHLPESFQSLLATPEPAELGRGPRPGVRTAEDLRTLLQTALESTDSVKANHQIISALVMLWHDHMDEAHQIAQEAENADGSFVHGIVHRREPDYGNATYWFRRVGRHKAFSELARRAEGLLEMHDEKDLKAELIKNGQWDAIGFINACERVHRRPGANGPIRILQEIQRLETEVLLETLLNP